MPGTLVPRAEMAVASGWQNKREAAAAHVIPSERLTKKHSEIARGLR
jgi:hypothetical protein